MDVYITAVHDFLDMPATKLVTEERAHRIAAMDSAEAKAACLAAGLLQRRILGERACRRIESDGTGKPYVPGGPFFSVARGGDIVALGVSAYGDIGVDVQQIGPFEPALAKEYFQEDELAWMQQQSDPQLAFSCLWTGKQSARKAAGFSNDLEASAFSLLPLSRAQRGIGHSSWYQTWRRIDGHMLCTTAMRTETLAVRRIAREDLIR